MINPQKALGWDVQEDGNGFYIYTKPGFEGCIRQNGESGTTEVFESREVVARPQSEGALYVEQGQPDTDGREEFERALLFVDTHSALTAFEENSR